MLVCLDGRRRQGLEEDRYIGDICHWLFEADDWLDVHREALIALPRAW